MAVPTTCHEALAGTTGAWGSMSADGPGLGTAPGRVEVPPTGVDRLARWLLVAVVLDLLVTRLVVRLAMFIPRDEPWVTPARVLGRLGAATDVLVPIVGVLLLGALVVRAARGGCPVDERATLVAVSLGAIGGFALVLVPPTPGLVLAIDLCLGASVVGAAFGFRHQDAGPSLVRPGLVALAAALLLVAVGRTLGAVEAIGWSGASGSGAAAGSAVGVWAQLAFVTGAGLVGMGGVLAGRASGTLTRRRLLVALAVVAVSAAGWMRGSASWDSLTIWSLGLSGVVPPLLLAFVLGLVIVGLPSLYRDAPRVAVGAAIVMASGVGLAASGLVLAGLLGLVVAGSRGDGGRSRPCGPTPVSSASGAWGRISTPRADRDAPAGRISPSRPAG